VSPGSPLFDVSVRHEDAAAWLVLRTFIQRWDLHPDSSGLPLRGGSLPVPTHSGPLTVQVTHTYGRDLPFTGFAVQTAATAIANGIKSARQFIYLEDQYCVGSPRMRAAVQDLLSSQPTAIAIFVLAAEDSVQDTPDIRFRRRSFFRDFVPAFMPRVMVFERLGAGSTVGPTAYVHSKLLIVDDEAAFVGSANSNRRSWSHDSEIDATIVDGNGAGGTASGTRGWVRDFRCELWSRHLGVAASTLGDPVAAIALWDIARTVGLPGSTVRPYDIFAPSVRPALVDVPASEALLDRLWDGVVDPA
jgi:phosphatidylserine/phosphatidylglycerophosphate/cardiolipin synthase-like enzyme